MSPLQTLPAWLRYLLAYWDFFAMLLLFGGVLCLVAYGLDRSDPSNLYLGIVLIIVVVLSSSFAYVQVCSAAADASLSAAACAARASAATHVVIRSNTARPPLHIPSSTCPDASSNQYAEAGGAS